MTTNTNTATTAPTYQDFKIQNASNLPKFDGKQVNFSEWETAVKDIARWNGIKCLLDGSTKPGNRTAEAWSEIEDKCIGWLFMSLDKSVRESLKEEESKLITVKDFMDYMAKTFSPSLSVNKYNTFLELCQVTQGSKTVTETCNEFKKIKALLNAQKVTLDDLYSLMLLNVFNPAYSITKQLITSAETVPDIDAIQSRMMSRETELNMDTAKESAAEAMVVARQGKGASNRNSNQGYDDKRKGVDRSKVCTNPICVKSGYTKGHTIEQCWRPGGGQEHAEIKPDWFTRQYKKWLKENKTPNQANITNELIVNDKRWRL